MTDPRVVDLLASIPSPAWSGFDIGPVRIHAYALCILLGIALALWLTNKRWQARGGTEDDLWTIAIWAIPAGIIGGRLYHVFSTPDPYFGPDGDPVAALYIWNGGLGIWGAVALGVLVVLFVCRRHGFRFTSFLDAAAPGLILAQAVGRWGNWFNQELFGAPTTLPWGLEIDRSSPTWPDPSLPADTLFHPTFLYELVWCVLVAVILVALDRKFRLGHGHVFALYVALYCLGRFGIELMRTDDATMVFGLRINTIVSAVVLLVALAYVAFKKPRHREDPNELLPKNQSGMTSEEPDRDEAVATGSAGHETGSAAEDRPERPGDGRE